AGLAVHHDVLDLRQRPLRLPARLLPRGDVVLLGDLRVRGTGRPVAALALLAVDVLGVDLARRTAAVIASGVLLAGVLLPAVLLARTLLLAAVGLRVAA